MNSFKPLCVISPSELLCLKRNKLYRYNSKIEESLYICDIPNSKLRNLFLFFNILTRRFGLNNAKAAKIDNHTCLLWYHYKFYTIDLFNHEISLTVGSNNKSLLHLNTSSLGPIWGEYGYNPNKDSKSIYRYNLENNAIECIYTFKKGEINHIHNIIEDSINNRFYILTGDFGNAAGIYYTDDSFKTVKSLVSGSQQYRSCFAIPFNNGLIYATDTPTQPNSLYFLKDGVLKRIAEINGSCIYACKYGDHFIGSTTVENQPDEYNNAKNKYRYNLGHGIKNWNVELFDYNLRTGDYRVLLRARKDILPMLAFGYGLFVLPILDETYKGNLFVFGQSIKRYDQKLVKVEV